MRKKFFSAFPSPLSERRAIPGMNFSQILYFILLAVKNIRTIECSAVVTIDSAFVIDISYERSCSIDPRYTVVGTIFLNSHPGFNRVMPGPSNSHVE